MLHGSSSVTFASIRGLGVQQGVTALSLPCAPFVCAPCAVEKAKGLGLIWILLPGILIQIFSSDMQVYDLHPHHPKPTKWEVADSMATI